ncbi:MAG: DUF1800 domain-containing protein [Burkholderiales bacterium]|nr:DUF1800 domain-containing protein [Burkholderiales bacterium]
MRRLVAALLAGALIGAGAGAAAAAGIGVDDARFLLARTGFAPTEAEVARLAPLARGEAVDALLAAVRTAAASVAPAWVDEPFERPPGAQSSEDARRAYQQREIRRGLELRSWWMREMLETPSPLTERMTLFWHNHFVSAQQKVRSAQLMYRQNLLLRQHALGNFGELLHAAAKDPAMLVYLDAATSRRAAPNENFAREVMELFTLGEGRYAERDIREAARAFTGWSVDPETGRYRWRPLAHDDGVKTVLGRTGAFDGDAVLDILLAEPATARFIVTKLWREFVAPDTSHPADAAEIERIAALFRGARYDLRTALRAILTSPRFYAPEHRGALVKSPVDLVVGLVRQLGVRYTDPLPFAMFAAGLGQNLFAPPNVRGWPGGEAWINSSTLLARRQLAERLLRADDPRGLMAGVPAAMTEAMLRPDAAPADAGGANRMRPEARAPFARAALEVHLDVDAFVTASGGPAGASLARILLAVPPVTPPPAGSTPRQQLRALLHDPAYQVK